MICIVVCEHVCLSSLSAHTLTLLILLPITMSAASLQPSVAPLFISLSPLHPHPHLPPICLSVAVSHSHSSLAPNPDPPPLCHTHTHTHSSIQPAQPPTQSQAAWIEVKNCHASSNVRRPFWIYDCALNVEAFEWVAAECSLCTWMNGSQANQTCNVSQRWLYNGTVVYTGTCESKADSTSPVSRPLCLKRQFMGLDLTSVLTFSHTPERGENVCHAHRMCVIVVQHCRLHSVLSEMLIPFGDNVFLEAQWREYRQALLLWTKCLQ